ncbi:MAG: LacI family DNA-binding transcriptional regulator [Acidobacteriaceae bacterium]|nr:LacI family DNA-binding transcriptional regulator [Acidobacteriaceae bacterium]
MLRAAAELNYYKNTSARLLVRGQSDLLGLIISDIENPFFPELIKSFEKACAAQRMEVLLCATNYDRTQAEAALRRMLENRVRGVAVMTSQFDRELEAQLTGKDVPLVLLGSPPARRYRSNIAINYRKGLSEAIRHLYTLGHREMALATGPQDQISAIAFKDAAVGEMRKLGLKPFRVVEGDHRPESGARATRELLNRTPRPTAILCGNDRMAIGALGTAEDLGFRVPEEFSIVGADDVWMTKYCHPPLTTIRIPRDVLGQLAFNVLMKMLSSKRKQGSEHVLDTELVTRRSTGEASGTELPAREIVATRINA